MNVDALSMFYRYSSTWHTWEEIGVNILVMVHKFVLCV